MTEKRRTNYSAPVGCIDLAATHEDGTAYEIWPCGECLPWHIEVLHEDDHGVFVREWHAIDCSAFQVLLRDD